MRHLIVFLSLWINLPAFATGAEVVAGIGIARVGWLRCCVPCLKCCTRTINNALEEAYPSEEITKRKVVLNRVIPDDELRNLVEYATHKKRKTEHHVRLTQCTHRRGKISDSLGLSESFGSASESITPELTIPYSRGGPQLSYITEKVAHRVTELVMERLESRLPPAPHVFASAIIDNLKREGFIPIGITQIESRPKAELFRSPSERAVEDLIESKPSFDEAYISTPVERTAERSLELTDLSFETTTLKGKPSFSDEQKALDGLEIIDLVFGRIHTLVFKDEDSRLQIERHLPAKNDRIFDDLFPDRRLSKIDQNERDDLRKLTGILNKKVKKLGGEGLYSSRSGRKFYKFGETYFLPLRADEIDPDMELSEHKSISVSGAGRGTGRIERHREAEELSLD